MLIKDLVINIPRNIRNKKIKKYIPANPVLLDLGCGKNFYLLGSLKNKIKRGHGVDINIKNKKMGNIETTRLSVYDKLPFNKNTFNVVSMIAFIEHIDKPDKIVRECNRVLTHGGRLIITTPTRRAKPFWETLVKMGLTDEPGIESHKHYFTLGELSSILKNNGFKVLESKRFEFGMNSFIVGEKLK